MENKIKPYLNPAIDKALEKYKKELHEEIAEKYATKNAHFKSIKEFKSILKDLLIKENKKLDYVTGYIVCLKDHFIVDLPETLELLKYTSSIYFKKMGWKK